MRVFLDQLLKASKGLAAHYGRALRRSTFEFTLSSGLALENTRPFM